MEKHIKINDTILLLDYYGTDSQDLYSSFRSAGFWYPAMVIEDNGFLPEDILSAYGFFLGDFKEVLGEMAHAKFFNQITVPEYWEISGNNSSGSVHDREKERGSFNLPRSREFPENRNQFLL